MTREPLLAELSQTYGPFLGPSALVSLLDFKSRESCMKALRSGVVDLPTFRMKGRPGHFAWTEDFVDWVLANKTDRPGKYPEQLGTAVKGDAHMSE